MDTANSININAIKDYFRACLKCQHLEDVTFEQVDAHPIGFLYHRLVRSSWDFEGTVCFENAESITRDQTIFLEQLAKDLNLIFGQTGAFYYLSQPLSLF